MDHGACEWTAWIVFDVFYYEIILYALIHFSRKDFISFRIDPSTPKVGALLKTTCSDDEDYDFDDTGVEVININSFIAYNLFQFKKQFYASNFIKCYHINTVKIKIDEVDDEQTGKRRKKRERGENEDEEKPEPDFASLGICLGDIMPAVREKYPKKSLHITFRSSRAPSVLFSSKNGGLVFPLPL